MLNLVFIFYELKISMDTYKFITFLSHHSPQTNYHEPHHNSWYTKLNNVKNQILNNCIISKKKRLSMFGESPCIYIYIYI